QFVRYRHRHMRLARAHAAEKKQPAAVAVHQAGIVARVGRRLSMRQTKLARAFGQLEVLQRAMLVPGRNARARHKLLRAQRVVAFAPDHPGSSPTSGFPARAAASGTNRIGGGCSGHTRKHAYLTLNPSPMSEAAARAIVAKLQAKGVQALFAGGAVRDHLLNPSIEVATFRTESSYLDGRHPGQVVYANTPQSDVARRDFTLNGLLLNPANGEILDFVGGRADLAAGLVRAIGDPERRFQEDHLRMLRAVRFAARFGFEIEAATLAAIRRHARQINQISKERVRDEIVKMLTEGRARPAFELLDSTGLLDAVLPEVARMKGIEQPPQYHPEGDVWVHTLMMINALPHPVAPALALGVLLHDVGKPPTFRRAPDRIRFDRHAAIGARIAEEICHRLRLSAQDTAAVVALVADHMQWIDLP